MGGMSNGDPQGTPPDPSGIQGPHDVLAAEEFAMPTRDDRYPADPTGIHEPHDVLAAEEFPMPAPEPTARRGRRDAGAGYWGPAAALAVVAGLVLLRRRRS